MAVGFIIMGIVSCLGVLGLFGFGYLVVLYLLEGELLKEWKSVILFLAGILICPCVSAGLCWFCWWQGSWIGIMCWALGFVGMGIYFWRTGEVT